MRKPKKAGDLISAMNKRKAMGYKTMPKKRTKHLAPTPKSPTSQLSKSPGRTPNPNAKINSMGTTGKVMGTAKPLSPKAQDHFNKTDFHKKRTKHKSRSKHLISPLTGLKEGSPKDVAMDQKMANSMHKKRTKHKIPKLGSGKRFSNLKSKLAKKGATNPGALAAFIGRKKFGAKKMAKLSASGKHKIMCKKPHKHTASC